MTLLSVSLFLIPALTGTLLIHLLLPERGIAFLLFKLALGMGLGLGVNSIIYFLTLLIAPAWPRASLILPGGLLILVLTLTILQERKRNTPLLTFPQISRVQWILLGVTASALFFSGLIFFNWTQSRPQGAYDAWGIWNRSARFIYRDPENWQATLSPDLYWGTHPDYPLLVPLNVAWGWSAIGHETPRTPMVQSAFFLAANLLLMFSSIYMTRTLGQASLATLVMVSTPVFISFGYGQIADSPLAFFILATTTLIYMYFKFDQPKYLILAGFIAGLGAWTKNEGLLFAVVSLFALFLAPGREEFSRGLRWYALGLLIPMIVVLYFKIALAPSSDLFAIGENNTSLLARVLDFSRYWIIIRAVVKTLFTYAGWPISIFIQMAVYALIMRVDGSKVSRHGALVIAVAVILQLFGYFAIYVVTPHDLVWHLNSALGRLIFHIFPTTVFLLFASVVDPENVFKGIDQNILS